MKKYKNIVIQIDDRLGLLTIDRKKENNALDVETSRVILGNKKFFSPGADIKELKSLDSKSAKSKGLFNYFDKIREIKIPILAAVEGYALGGGMELALLCDVIIASKESRFGQLEINLGLIPGIGGTQRLKNLLGKHNANYLCMSGEIISGQRAYELGLISVLLEKNNFLIEAVKVTKKITKNPKSSLIEIKKLISNSVLLDEGLEAERKSFYNLLDHENAKNGINAFLNKIEINWKD